MTRHAYPVMRGVCVCAVTSNAQQQTRHEWNVMRYAKFYSATRDGLVDLCHLPRLRFIV